MSVGAVAIKTVVFVVSSDIDDLLNQKITFRSPASGQLVQVPISAVADIKYTSTFSAVKRKNLKRVITIYSNVLEGYNANEIIAEMDAAMALYPLSDELAYEFTGEQRQKYAAKVKDISEEARIALRNTRRDLNKHSDALQKTGELTEDDNRKLHTEIQDMLKSYEGKVDEVLKKKVDEIQEV